MFLNISNIKQPGIIGSLFSGFEDVKTLAGLQGYAITKGTEFLFGKSNPYEKRCNSC